MRPLMSGNKGGAEFSLLTAIVLAGAAYLLVLAALCSGWLETKEGPERLTYDAAMAMLQEEEEEPAVPVIENGNTLAGSGWTSPEGDYYFTPENDELFYINDKTENYIRGSVSVKKVSAAELMGTEGEAVLTGDSVAEYFRIDALVLEELYFGSRRGGYSYVLYMGIDGDEAYIYDSGWGETVNVERVEYPLQASLEDHFASDQIANANVWGPGGDPSVFSREDVDFNTVENIKESWNAIEIGNSIVLKREGDNGVIGLYVTAMGSTEDPEPLYIPADGRDITVFGTDGYDLIFGLGKVYSGGYDTEELMLMDMGNGLVSSLVKDRVQDFCVADGIIYYTDYDKLVRLDKYGRTELLWDYTVYSYEVADDMIFLYDGDAWELLDAKTGEDYGYIVNGLEYGYECDISKHTEDYIYYVAYDYNRTSISLWALNIWTGDVRMVGDEYEGRMSDTYNVLFKDTFCYFTAGNGEKLVRVDVSTGTTTERDLSDAGWWYATEIMDLGGECVLHAYDPYGSEIYLSVGDDLQMTEIPALTPPRG